VPHLVISSLKRAPGTPKMSSRNSKHISQKDKKNQQFLSSASGGNRGAQKGMNSDLDDVQSNHSYSGHEGNCKEKDSEYKATTIASITSMTSKDYATVKQVMVNKGHNTRTVSVNDIGSDGTPFKNQGYNNYDFYS
jgi:hypothetical protein